MEVGDVFMPGEMPVKNKSKKSDMGDIGKR